jgi:hypothetical protein
MLTKGVTSKASLTSERFSNIGTRLSPSAKARNPKTSPAPVMPAKRKNSRRFLKITKDK